MCQLVLPIVRKVLHPAIVDYEDWENSLANSE